jgi:hypothetical protein
VGLHPIAVPYQLPCEQRCKENDQSGGHECGKFEHEHIDELNDEEKTRKHFHGLYRLSKDSLVGLPPTPPKEWQQDKDHQSIERGTTQREGHGRRLADSVDSEVEHLGAHQGQDFVMRDPVDHSILTYKSADKGQVIHLEESHPAHKPQDEAGDCRGLSCRSQR